MRNEATLQADLQWSALLEFSRLLYGLRMELHFLQKLVTKTFFGPDELKAQKHSDIENLETPDRTATPTSKKRFLDSASLLSIK